MIKILLVEDDEFLQQLYSDILSPHYELHVVGDGEKAYEILKKEVFDLVLLDITLPSMRGDEIIKQLSDDNKNKIVVLTNTSDERELEQIKPKIQGIIYKSKIDPDDLVKKVKEYVD